MDINDALRERLAGIYPELLGTIDPMASQGDWLANLMNPAKAAEALPEIQELIQSKRRELTDLEELYEFLRRKAGYEPAEGAIRAGSTTETVVNVLSRAKAPMRAREVAAAIGPDANRDTVSWALWDAARRGLIKKLSPGLYAALSYQREELRAAPS